MHRLATGFRVLGERKYQRSIVKYILDCQLLLSRDAICEAQKELG